MCSKDSLDKASLLFEECIELADPAKRREYLNDACRGKPMLRAEVEKLLRAHEESGSFLMGGLTGVDERDDGGIKIPEFKPGEIVGKYRVMGLIGEGSTSTVFLAEQEEPIRRWVALKIVKAGMDTRKVILRFGMERQALALMDHPGIAKLLDAGATPNGRPFFVMELVSGTTITEYCDENKLKLPDRLNLFTQVCSAVFHAHQRGIIHRDLKPDNILVSNVDGTTILKIVDFGIAKVLHSWGTDSGTQTGMMPFLGTPAYMSPEQVQLNSTALDTRTDIYSLGALLYELFVGHPPFDLKHLLSDGLEEMCRIIRTEEPLAPSIRLSRLPEKERREIAEARGTNPMDLQRKLVGDLDWITLKALEKQRERRYSTASSLILDVRHYFNHMPVSAAKPSPGYKFKKLVKRKRKLVVASGIVAALLVVSTFLIFMMGIQAKISAGKARDSEIAAMEAEQESNVAMVAMHVTSGISAADNNRPDQALLWFANAARLAAQKGLREDAHARRAMFWMAESSVPVGAFKLSGPLTNLEFSNDSDFLLAAGSKGKFEIWDALLWEKLPWTVTIDKSANVKISPNGLYLAMELANGEMCVMETASGNVIHSIKNIPEPHLIQFSENSRYVSLGDPSREVLDIFESTAFNRIQDYDGSYSGANIMFQNPSIVGVAEDGWAQVFTMGNSMGMLSQTSEKFQHMGFIRSDSCSSSTDYQEEFLKTPKASTPALIGGGSRLLTRTGSYEISLWDTATSELVQKIDEACCSCEFTSSRESELMACGLQGGIVGIWEIFSGEQKQLIPSQGSCILDIDFGMHGTQLVTADAKGLARVWDIQEGKQAQPPMHHCMDIDSVAYSDDGKLIATAQADGLVRIWRGIQSNPERSAIVSTPVPTKVHMSNDGGTFVLTRDPAWGGSPKSCIQFTTLFSTATGRPVGTTRNLNGCVEAAVFSNDSKTLVIGVADCGTTEKGSLEFHDLANPQKQIAGIQLPSAPDAIAWSPIDSKIGVLCYGGELMIGQFGQSDFEKWSDKKEFVRQQNNAQLAFTKDGELLVSLGPDGSIEVRDAETGFIRYPPLSIAPNDFWAFSLSPDNKYLATSTTDGKVSVWDLAQGFPVSPILKHPTWVYTCRFSPDQKTLVTTSHDGYVRVWDWQKAEMMSEPMLHPGEVYDAIFTPDSQWLLTACRDGNLRVFDPESGQILTPPIKIGRQAFNIEISPDGSRAVLGSLNDQVSVFSLELLAKKLPLDVEELCLLGEVVSSSVIQNGTLRNLTTSEWMEKYDTLMRIDPELIESFRDYSKDKLRIETMPIFTSNSLLSDDSPPAMLLESTVTVHN